MGALTRRECACVAVLMIAVACRASSVVEILSRGDAAPGEAIAEIPVGTEDGSVSGVVSLYAGDEPSDAVAAFCHTYALPPWFRKAIVEKVCGGSYGENVVCGRRRALLYESAIQTPDDPTVNYPGKLTVWEDEAPAAAVELFLAAAEKEILKNRTAWDAEHDLWAFNRTENLDVVAASAGLARRKEDRERALGEISELDWLLENHTRSEPMRIPEGWFRKALLDHACGLPGLDCAQGRPLPELPITLDGSAKPRGVIRMFEGASRAIVPPPHPPVSERATRAPRLRRRRGRGPRVPVREAARLDVGRVPGGADELSVLRGGREVHADAGQGLLAEPGGRPGRPGHGVLAQVRDLGG